jgi:predicted transcriptional regulator
MTNRRRAGALVALALTCLAATSIAAAQVRSGGETGIRSLAAAPSCRLNSANGNIKHVIYIQFDNTHFRRDNANVPSDLEQMPHLLNFIRGNGTLMTNDHTVLISHTATGILSSLTGVYPDRMGQPISNSFRYFTPAGTTRTGVSFAYWTSPLFDPAPGQTDFTPEMINEQGKIAPAPWVPYTRAGCDVGSVATANTILENTAIDIPTVFGPGSPEAAEVASNPGQAFADFVGIGVHCAVGSSLCDAANHGRPDLLPDEPGGYSGFNGLFGAKYVDPQIGMSTPTDLNGNTIQDAAGHVGFPGFDGMEATVSLSWVAHMQESGIPITYAYISDAHDGHGTAGNIHFAYGPGEAGYVQQLKDYDNAFAKFFDRLAADGINKSNTLFVVTVDEGDHFAGDQPTPAGCDGVTTPCTYNRVGEINADLRRMVRTQFGDTTNFTVHSDDAPNVYVTGNPGPTDAVTRNLEREMAQLSWLNPYTSTVENNIMVALADKTEMKTLHMVTADPARTPTFTPFADPNWFFFATGGPNCATPADCASIPPRTNQSFAWNHGDIQDEIASTWVGMVGPGVKNEPDYTGWTDHTDVRPTMLTLLGLKDDYQTDGRAVVEPLFDWAVPQTLRAHRETLLRLGAVYKQLTASFGTFAMDTLKASTRGLASGSSSDDSTYTQIDNAIRSLTARRDALMAQIRTGLNDAEFSGQALDEQQAKGWIDDAQALLNEAAALGAGS